jgi:hypothetical protein
MATATLKRSKAKTNEPKASHVVAAKAVVLLAVENANAIASDSDDYGWSDEQTADFQKRSDAIARRILAQTTRPQVDLLMLACNYHPDKLLDVAEELLAG